jgi:sarcosine oxidase gamma subunit
LNIEPGGQVLGQRAAYLHVSGSVVSVSDGKTFLRISGKTREFGATLVDAVRKAAATLGRSVAADVLRRVTNGAGTESP